MLFFVYTIGFNEAIIFCEGMMKNYILGVLGGFICGSIGGYLCLLFVAPMGGGQMSVSALPWIVGVALGGGLMVQALLFSVLQ